MDGSAAEEPDRGTTTDLLVAARGAGDGALERLLPVVYDELRRLAASYLKKEAHGHTLQPTALAHEAWLRMVDATRVDWRDRAQFLAIAARMMRHVLVDHARAKKAAKRGGGQERVTMVDAAAPAGASALDVLDVDDALEELGRMDPRKARVVELRFFGGLTEQEAAHALGVSATTVEDDWRFARAWLHRRLGA
jgi:RNA polymerase sigma factor (TIGR02999 family)